LDVDTVNAKKAYDAGAQGGHAKALSPDLAGKTMPEIEAILDADAAANNCVKRVDTSAGKPMSSYQYRDGTLVRLKPRGDAHESEPMYSVEVNKHPGTPASTQDDVAF